MKDFKEKDMAYAKKRIKKSQWVSVPLSNHLHEEVRVTAARRHLAWPDIIAEAVALWLAAQARKA
ncbi:MAG: hypothetical protein ACRELB_00750, partial [Polyangiaceae bacterium]